MMKKLTYRLSTALAIILVMVACKKDEQIVASAIPGNEFITTVKIKFENTSNPADTVWAIWKDLTPEDANPPDTSLAIANLKKNSTYTSHVYFLDETKNPAVDITAEIKERANYHRFFFFPSQSILSYVTITPTDYDSNNPPLVLGLENTFITTDNLAEGRLEGVLKHQPNLKDGTFAPGSTDLDVFFRFNIIP